MTMAQACTRFLGAAVVVIAFAFALIPSAAWAHAAHHHTRTAAHDSREAQGVSSSPSGAGTSPIGRAAARRAARAQDTTREVAVSGELDSTAGVALAAATSGANTTGCVAGCCALGSGCCPGHAAVTPEADLMAVAGPRVAVPPVPTSPSDVAPPALTEPPRSIV